MSALNGEDAATTPRPGLMDGLLSGGRGDRAEFLRRLLFTLGALFVYRLGSHLPIPGLDLAVLQMIFEQSSEALGMLSQFAGISLERISIFGLGITPYIWAFIIIQLACRVIPYFGRLSTGGAAGNVKLNQYVRAVTVVLAAFQAIEVASTLENFGDLTSAPGFLFKTTTVITLTAGALYLAWLAEQISMRGLGEGAFVILACYVAGNLPAILVGHIQLYHSGFLAGSLLLEMAAVTAASLALVAFVERAERPAPIRDSRPESGQGRLRDGDSHGPLRINPAGLIPAFAAGMFAAPLVRMIESIGGDITIETGHAGPSYLYLLLYAALIILFAGIFNFTATNSGRVARERADSEGHPPRHESTESTARPLQLESSAMAAAYLVILCVVPLWFYRWREFPFLLTGVNIYLFGWLTLRILERTRVSRQP